MVIGFTIVPAIIDDILSAEEWVYWGGATYCIFDIVSENLAVLAAINCPRSSRKIAAGDFIPKRRRQFKDLEISSREAVFLATCHYCWRKLYFSPVTDGKQVNAFKVHMQWKG